MKRIQAIAAILLALAVGFFSGRLSSRDSGAARAAFSKETPARARLAPPSVPGNEVAHEDRRRVEIKQASSGQVPSRVFQALEAGDPVMRAQLMADLLRKMDAGNFREMLAEAERVSNETGREHTGDWILMNIRAGQVAGNAAMEDWKAKGLKSEAAWKTFYGWANSDPAAARQWMDQQGDLEPDQRAKLLESLVSGSVIHNPEDAAKMLGSLSEEDRMTSLHGFSNSLVDAAGKEGAIHWLETLQSTERDSPFTEKATTRVFDRLVWSGANRLNAASMVSDLERLSTVITIDENWIVRSMGQIRDRRATGGIELLDEIAKSPVLKDQPLTDRAWSSAVDFAIDRDRAAVGEWLAAHPGSPIYQKVSERFER